MDSKKMQSYQKRFFMSLFVIVLVLFAVTGFYNHDRKEGDIGKQTVQTKIQQPDLSVAHRKDLTPDQLSVVSGIVYRHLVAYNLVCSEVNAPLQSYPEYFSKKYASAIQRINTAWEKRGKSLEAVLLEYDSRIYPKTAPDIKKELIDNERLIIKVMKAQEQGISPDKVEWTDKQEAALTLSDACLLFDETASKIGEKSGFDAFFEKLMTGI